MKKGFFWIVALTLMGWLQCCTLHDTAGGSDHPNELVGQVANRGDQEVVVRLYRMNDAQNLAKVLMKIQGLPQVSQEVSPDSEGRFVLKEVEAGTYYVEAIRQDSSAVQISEVLLVPEDSRQVQWPLNVGLLSLKVPGRIPLESSVCDDAFYVRGTHYQSEFNEDSVCTIPFVPSAKSYQLIQVSSPDTVWQTIFVNAGSHPDYPLVSSEAQKLEFLPVNNGDTILVREGDTLTVTLSTNASTGYEWIDYSDSSMLEVLQTQPFCPDTELVGASCELELTWIVPSGIATQVIIDMRYEQSWDVNSMADQFALVLTME